MRVDCSSQIGKVISSSQEIKEAIAAFYERMTMAETQISKAEEDIA